MGHDKKYDASEILPVCVSCGRCLGGDGCTSEPGCAVCDLCTNCAPAAGNCRNCADMRREDLADQTRRYALENEVCS